MMLLFCWKLFNKDHKTKSQFQQWTFAPYKAGIHLYSERLRVGSSKKKKEAQCLNLQEKQIMGCANLATGLKWCKCFKITNNILLFKISSSIWKVATWKNIEITRKNIFWEFFFLSRRYVANVANYVLKLRG